MPKAKILMDLEFGFLERFWVKLKVFQFEPDEKYPQGIKARFVLVDTVRKVPLLLVDNHEPFGFHVHEELPENKNTRRMLKTTDYWVALTEFRLLAERIVNDENQST